MCQCHDHLVLYVNMSYQITLLHYFIFQFEYFCFFFVHLYIPSKGRWRKSHFYLVLGIRRKSCKSGYPVLQLFHCKPWLQWTVEGAGHTSLQGSPLSSEHTPPSTLATSEQLGSFMHVLGSTVLAVLNVLKQLKTFPSQGHFDFGEEQEITGLQVQ